MSRRAKVPALPESLVDPMRGAVVGRADELGLLGDLWAEASAGTSGVVLVGGDPGTGKTRLVTEIGRRVSLDHGLVLSGSCRRGRAVPFVPFVAALRPVAVGLPDAWWDRHVLDHGPSLARMLDLAPRVPAVARTRESGTSWARVAGAIRNVLEEAASRAPVLLVIEDLHWATRSTARALEHLAEARSPAPLLIVATYRSGEITPNHPAANLLASLAADRLNLAPLSPREVVSFLVDRLALAGEPASVLAARLWKVTEGNPLFLVESVRDLVEGGLLHETRAGVGRLATTELPADLDEAVARRLRRQPDLVREVVEIVAVAEADVGADAVAEVAMVRIDAVEQALGGAAAGGFLAPEAQGSGDPGRTHWTFTHAAVRDAVYRSISPSRRLRLHERLADASALTPGEDPPAAVLAHHYLAASPVGGSEKALRHAVRAAEEAAAVLAFDEAAEQYGHGISMLGATGAAAVRIDLLLDLGACHRRAGDPARARQAFLQAAYSARASGDGVRLAKAALGLGEVNHVWGADEELVSLLSQALEQTRADPSLQAQLLGRLAEAKGAGTLDQRKALSDQAWELAWDSRDPATMGSVLSARHQALSSPEDLADRIEAAGELLAMAAASADGALALRAHGWRYVDLLEHGSVTDADRDLAAFTRLAAATGDARDERRGLGWQAARSMLRGEHTEAAAAIDRAHALGGGSADHGATGAYWSQMWALLLDWGDEADLEDLVPVWLELVDSHGNHPAWRARLALLLAFVDRRAEASAIVEDLADGNFAAVPADRSWLPTVAVVAEAAARVRAQPQARAAMQALGPFSRRLVVLDDGKVVWGSVARAAGLAALVGGRRADAVRHMATALEVLSRAGALPMLARTRAEWGAVLARATGPEDHLRGHDLLTAAHEEARRLGMTRLAAQARDSLGGD